MLITFFLSCGHFALIVMSRFEYYFELQALDFVVSEAKKYKIRLILSLANNWDAYGGKAQYVKWGKAAGLNLTSDDDFFSHPTLRSYYKAYVKASFFCCALHGTWKFISCQSFLEVIEFEFPSIHIHFRS